MAKIIRSCIPLLEYINLKIFLPFPKNISAATISNANSPPSSNDLIILRYSKNFSIIEKVKKRIIKSYTVSTEIGNIILLTKKLNQLNLYISFNYLIQHLINRPKLVLNTLC